MTLRRRPEIRFSDAPQGVCRWCGEDIVFESGAKKGSLNRRRRWHPNCVDIYNASDPREARRRIRKRDRGRCAVCRVDTYKIRRELRKIRRGQVRAIRERGYKPGQSFWELDHIVPLVDGGSHGDENLQTLCTPCHIEKTAAEARARAVRSRTATAEGRKKPASRVESRMRSKTTPTKLKYGAIEPQSIDELLEAADAVNARVVEALDGMIPS